MRGVAMAEPLKRAVRLPAMGGSALAAVACRYDTLRLSLLFRHAHAAQAGALPRGSRHRPADYLVDWRTSLRRADRACCCPAVPTVVVIMPSVPDRPRPVDLLLCRHHYRAHADALAAAGAAALDTCGEPLTPETLLLMQASS